MMSKPLKSWFGELVTGDPIVYHWSCILVQKKGRVFGFWSRSRRSEGVRSCPLDMLRLSTYTLDFLKKNIFSVKNFIFFRRSKKFSRFFLKDFWKSKKFKFLRQISWFFSTIWIFLIFKIFNFFDQKNTVFFFRAVENHRASSISCNFSSFQYFLMILDALVAQTTGAFNAPKNIKNGQELAKLFSKNRRAAF